MFTPAVILVSHWCTSSPFVLIRPDSLDGVYSSETYSDRSGYLHELWLCWKHRISYCIIKAPKCGRVRAVEYIFHLNQISDARRRFKWAMRVLGFAILLLAGVANLVRIQLN